MKYVSMYKVRYKYPSKWEEILQQRTNSEDTIKLNIDIHGSRAFICQCSELMNLIIQIHKKDKTIRALRMELPGIALHQFTQRCLIDEIVLTNDIEGVNSTRREIREILEEAEEKKKNKRFYGIVMKYTMLSHRDELSLKNCEDIRNIYNDLVLKEVVEENPMDEPDGDIFRKGSVSVTNSAQKEIHQGLLPEEAIKTAVQSVLDFLANESIDLFIRIGAAHYLIGYIHPFYNGNGRLSRFISSFLLSQELDPLIGYRLSYTIKENLKQYDEAFKLCNDPREMGDITPFVIWFNEIVLEAINKLEQALLERKQDLENCDKKIKESTFLKEGKERELAYILAQASLFADDGITMAELMEYTKLSRNTIKMKMSGLAESDLLITKKSGKVKYYKLDLEKLFK